MTTERLFLALWPDAAVRAALAALIVDVRDGRAVRAQDLHITLVFLGAVDAARRVRVEQTCAGIRAPAFELALTDLRWRARPRMVWAVPARTPQALQYLVDELNRTLGRCAWHKDVPGARRSHALSRDVQKSTEGLLHHPVGVEARRFRAHVTLARDVRRRVPQRTFAAIPWSVREFCLVSSRLAAGGSSYTVQRRWPLMEQFTGPTVDS